MTELERVTYEQWLSQPRMILDLLRKFFEPIHESFAWGKCRFIGLPL